LVVDAAEDVTSSQTSVERHSAGAAADDDVARSSSQFTQSTGAADGATSSEHDAAAQDESNLLSTRQVSLSAGNLPTALSERPPDTSVEGVWPPVEGNIQ